MPEQVGIREDLGLIEVSSRGIVNIADMLRSCDAVVRFHEQRGISKVLVDLDPDVTMPTIVNLFEFGEGLTKHTAFRTIKLAMVVRKDMNEQAKIQVQFVETVARNRGYRWQMFDTVDKALAWLQT